VKSFMSSPSPSLITVSFITDCDLNKFSTFSQTHGYTCLSSKTGL
jgi:hypothetical protein